MADHPTTQQRTAYAKRLEELLTSRFPPGTQFGAPNVTTGHIAIQIKEPSKRVILLKIAQSALDDYLMSRRLVTSVAAEARFIDRIREFLANDPSGDQEWVISGVDVKV